MSDCAILTATLPVCSGKLVVIIDRLAVKKAPAARPWKARTTIHIVAYTAPGGDASRNLERKKTNVTVSENPEMQPLQNFIKNLAKLAKLGFS